MVLILIEQNILKMQSHNVTEMIGEIDFIFVFGSIQKHFQGSIDNFQNFIL